MCNPNLRETNMRALARPMTLWVSLVVVAVASPARADRLFVSLHNDGTIISYDTTAAPRRRRLLPQA